MSVQNLLAGLDQLRKGKQLKAEQLAAAQKRSANIDLGKYILSTPYGQTDEGRLAAKSIDLGAVDFETIAKNVLTQSQSYRHERKSDAKAAASKAASSANAKFFSDAYLKMQNGEITAQEFVALGIAKGVIGAKQIGTDVIKNISEENKVKRDQQIKAEEDKIKLGKSQELGKQIAGTPYGQTTYGQTLVKGLDLGVVDPEKAAMGISGGYDPAKLVFDQTMAANADPSKAQQALIGQQAYEKMMLMKYSAEEKFKYEGKTVPVKIDTERVYGTVENPLADLYDKHGLDLNKNPMIQFNKKYKDPKQFAAEYNSFKKEAADILGQTLPSLYPELQTNDAIANNTMMSQVNSAFNLFDNGTTTLKDLFYKTVEQQNFEGDSKYKQVFHPLQIGIPYKSYINSQGALIPLNLKNESQPEGQSSVMKKKEEDDDSWKQFSID